MLITDQKPLVLLNHLITVNNDRIEGYNCAGRQTNVEVLKALFERLEETSRQCREELCGEVYKLGGKPTDGSVASPDVFKAWLEMMAAIGKNDHPAILNSCAREEDIIIDHYDYALHFPDEHITSQQLRIFSRQKECIETDREKVNNLLYVLMRN